MNRRVKWLIAGGIGLAAAAGITILITSTSNGSGEAAARFGVAKAKAAEPIGHIGTSRAAQALEKAGQGEKYAFALFYREENEQTAHLRAMAESARKKISRKSEIIEINVTDSTTRDIVQKLGAGRVAQPLTLVVAPNGAIMGGFTAGQLADDSKLVDAVGCKAAEQTMKALQQKNMVLLCVQNRRTADNKGAKRGVDEFLKDPKYGPATAVVEADPADPATGKFLSQIGLDPACPVASTALLAPPGVVVGRFQGATEKDQILSAVQAATAPRSGGCCPPGSGRSCGPVGQTAVPQKAPVAAQPQSAPVTAKRGG